jgi:hypothetical protein
VSEDAKTLYADLSGVQRERVAALRAAREVLAARNLGGSSAVDAVDLTSVASFIVTGDDPYSGGTA